LIIGGTDRCAISVRRRLTEEPDANRHGNIEKVELHDRQTRSLDKTPGASSGHFNRKEIVRVSRVAIVIDFRK
jgi:hypothetical protein